MNEIVACPACGRRLRLPDHAVGAAVRCPGCGATFQANPGQEAVQAVPPPRQEGYQADTPAAGWTGPGEFEDLASGPGFPDLPATLPGGGVAAVLVVFLVLGIVVDLGTALLAVLQQEVAAGGAGPNPADDLFALFDCLPAAGMLPTVVLFCMWMYRSYRNLQDMGVKGLNYSPGWAAGSFFVPILNLFRPYQIAQETWRASDPSTPADQPRAWRRMGGSPVILFWWLAWIASSIAYNIVFRANLSGETNPELPKITLFAAAMSSVAALFAILMILRLRRRQERKLAALRDE